MKKILPLLFFSAFCLFAAGADLYAAESALPVAQVNYNELNKELNKIDNTLKSGSATQEYMNDNVQRISEIRKQLNDAKRELDKELQYTQKKLDALGDGPADGTKEVGVIAQKRKEFNAELASQKGKIAEADIILTRLDELDTKILNLRSRELFGNMFDKQSPLVYPSNFFYANKLFVSFLYGIMHSPVNWYENLSQEQRSEVYSSLMPVLFTFFLSLWIGVYLRLFIMRKFGYDKEIEHPRYGKKVSAAVFVAIAYGVIPSSIVAGLLIWIASSPLMTGYFAMTIGTFLYFSLYVLLGRAIARVVFAPYNPRWRLVNVSDEKALRLTSAFYGAINAIGLFGFLEHMADKSDFSIELSSYISAMGCFVKAFFIVVIVKRLLWDGVEYNEDDDNTENPADESVDSTFKITFMTILSGIILCGISVFGYPFLSAFILNRLILTFILLGFLFIIRKAFEEIMHRLLLLRFWAKTFRLKRRLLSKLNFWLSLVVDPLFALLAIYMVLALWGVSTEVLNHSIVKLFTGFTIGGIKISLLSIMLGILVFFIGVNIVKALKRRLSNNLLSKMDIDEGIKASLESGFGSVGFVISALIAIAIMGGDLSNLALIAGALSVGIGLGLQNIVNNFVSGIILLFERPIKVGDWVIINGEEGKVKQINIRSTEVETFKRSSLIIPNANLLSTTVTNLTHSNNNARLSLSVGVAYGTDTRKVANILLECAEKHKRVLKKPEPSVVFKDFGESSLDFELRCYTNDIWSGWSIPSDLRYEIDRRFREEGIEIPFPQRSLHIGDEITRKTLNHMLQDKTGLKVVRKHKKVKLSEEDE